MISLPRDSMIPAPGSRNRVCVYDVNSISGMSAFSSMVGRRVIDCSMVYTGASYVGTVDESLVLASSVLRTELQAGGSIPVRLE